MPLIGTPELDLRLEGFRTDEQTAAAFYQHITLDLPSLVAHAEHHSPDGSQSFYVLHDRSATWGFPGLPQYIALHLQRDLGERTFVFEHAKLPLPAMAQSWLIHRGCPPQSIELRTDLGRPAPADQATRALEKRLTGDGDHFTYGYSYTQDHGPDIVTVVALRALDARASSEYRVVVEEVDGHSWTRTTREGGFDTVQDALRWCDDRLAGRAGPLPPVRPSASPNRPGPAPAAPAPRSPGRSH
ncbi:hypothetical protein [Streptomyces buecherae]|uniref:hypothetical protein n=1 Tax=Streptomyces buecherae TaxID=2763006 RepID=UPI001C27FC64|nr:hypothetical protein [Streptomyces buecherae]